MLELFGLVRYYRRFVWEFLNIAMLMTKLLQKNKKFEWDNKCEPSYMELGMRLTMLPVLISPFGMEGFIIYSDASSKGLGYVLMQHKKVVTYSSQ